MSKLYFAGHMKSVWSLDNVFIGGSVINADSLVAILDSEPNIVDWLFWPGGIISRYCGFNIRSSIPPKLFVMDTLVKMAVLHCENWVTCSK